MNDIEKILKSLDPSVIGRIKKFAETNEGKKIISQFSSLDKEQLVKKVSTMSNEEKDAVLSKLPLDPHTAEKIKDLK